MARPAGSNHHERERTERDDVERKHRANRGRAEQPAHNRADREPDERRGGEQAEPRPSGAGRNDRRRSGIRSGHAAADRNPEDWRGQEQPPDIMHQDVESCAHRRSAGCGRNQTRRRLVSKECGTVMMTERAGAGRK